MSKPTKIDVNPLAVMSCLFAATLWGLLWYPMRQLENMGIAGIPATFLVYVAALIPLLPACFKYFPEISRQPRLFLLLALTAGWANLGFILALLEGTVVRVLLLFYLSPVWTVIFGWLILHESPNRLALFTIMMAMSGAVIMLWQPDVGMAVFDGAADILAITAGIAFAMMNVLIRKADDVPVVMKMIPAIIGVILLCLVVLPFLAEPLPVITLPAIGLAVAVGAIGMFIMTFTAQYGVTHLPVHRSAILFLFEIVAGALSAALLTSEIVTVREWSGGILVIIAACFASSERLQAGTGMSNNEPT